MKSYINSKLRAISALRMRHYMKRVQHRWRLFMGTEKINHINRAWKSLEETRALAES